MLLMQKRLVISLLVGALMAAMLPGVASAAKPESFTDRFGPETFHDEFLTEECGVDVYTTVQGKVQGRFFGEDGKGVLFVNNVNIKLVARAGDNSFRFHDVGSDHVHQGPDGSMTLLVTGQVPFGFKGVEKIDANTWEVIKEANRTVDTAQACSTLTS
jgi:hypothetical protein